MTRNQVEKTHIQQPSPYNMSNIDDFSSSDEEDNNLLLLNKNKKTITTTQDNESDDNEVLDPISEQQVYVPSKETTAEDKLKKLEKLKVYKNKKKSKYKPGVVYISKLPPYMKPQKLRQVLQKFGEIDRIYMKKESEQNRKNRLKQGGNKKDKYEEGWVEFIKKSDAKLCCSTLNGNILGGKKNSFYYDDVMNMKYLSGFKWTDLTEQMAKESEQRQSKLELEINNANKLNEMYIKNVEQSKMVNNIQKSGKRTRDDNDHVIAQRKTYTKRFKDNKAIKEDKSNDLSSVLGSI